MDRSENRADRRSGGLSAWALRAWRAFCTWANTPYVPDPTVYSCDPAEFAIRTQFQNDRAVERFMARCAKEGENGME
jgi:hypothetical protein